MKSQIWFAATLLAASLIASVSAAEPSDEFTSATIDLGVVVSDVAKSVKFYTEAVGFTEAPGFKVAGQYIATVGLTDGREELDIHMLALGDAPTATKLKLMQFKATPKTADNAGIQAQLGFRYLTIHVADMNKSLARLAKAGVKPAGDGAQRLPKGLPQDLFLAVVRDPDGNFVELVGPKK